MELSGADFGRKLHLASTMWAFVLMSVHLGTHFSSFVSMGRKADISKQIKIVVVWVERAAVAAISAYGVYVFIVRKMYEELFLLTAFKFYDYDATQIGYLFGTFAVSSAIVSATYYLQKLYFYVHKKRSLSKP